MRNSDIDSDLWQQGVQLILDYGIDNLSPQYLHIFFFIFIFYLFIIINFINY